MRHRILAELEKANVRDATKHSADEFSMESLAARSPAALHGFLIGDCSN